MANDEAERVTFSIEGPDGTDELTLPEGVLHLLSEEDDETMAEVVGDIATMAFASRAHTIAHHSEGEPSSEVREIEDATLEAFEERFGVSYAEATGHQH